MLTLLLMAWALVLVAPLTSLFLLAVVLPGRVLGQVIVVLLLAMLAVSALLEE